MRTPQSLALTLVATALIAAATTSPGQVPQMMNYQAMLTDDAGEPLVNQAVELVFRIYDAGEVGDLKWSETHNTVTNSIGVVSVILGSQGSPLGISFAEPLWLEVDVDGETLSPRRQLVAAPYARHANDSDQLGGGLASEYAQLADLGTPGSINDPGNPVDWTKLKGVPGGFSDGVDDAGEGDGHSLDASDGDPADVVHVDPAGNVYVGPAAFWGNFNVQGLRNSVAGFFGVDAALNNSAAVLAKGDSTHGLVGNSKTGDGIASLPTVPSAVAGVAANGAYAGTFLSSGEGHAVLGQSSGDGDAVRCQSSGGGDALYAYAEGTGYSGVFHGGAGVAMTITSGYPALGLNSATSAGDADAAWFSAGPSTSTNTWAIYGVCDNGSAGYLEKTIDDNQYAVYIKNETATSEGLAVQGTIYSTAPMTRGVETSRGTEAVFGVTGPEVEVIASGHGRLSGGSARIEFDRIFAESTSGPSNLRVTATPIGAWSALYVESIDRRGFGLRSDAGDGNVEFHWVAVGRARGHERRPEVTIPDHDELQRLADLKRGALRSLRPDESERLGSVRLEELRPAAER